MKNESSQNQRKILTGFVVLAIMIALFFIIRPAVTGKSFEDSQIEKFAQCLTNAGIVMYGTEWCPHCQNQKKLFGKAAFKNINYVDCDFNKETCAIQGVQGYPTWKINGSSYPGEQSFERLSELTGCVL